MNPRLAHLLVRLYPARWRDRLANEFEAFLETGPGDLATAANVIASALSEHVFPTHGAGAATMNQDPPSFAVITRQPSAFLPLAMSLAALALVLVHVAIYGAVREVDEGATGHLWQILMAAQIPIVAFFAIKGLPRSPKPTLKVVILQAGALLANIAAVFFFNLG